jgi:hypothetical protein
VGVVGSVAQNSAESIARRANRIAITALVISTVVSLISLVLTIRESVTAQKSNERQAAANVTLEPSTFLDENRKVYKFGNHNAVPVYDFHAVFKGPSGEVFNFYIGNVPGCQQVDLLTDTRRFKYVQMSFMDSDDRSWIRLARGDLKTTGRVDDLHEAALPPYNPDTVPSTDMTPLSPCS